MIEDLLRSTSGPLDADPRYSPNPIWWWSGGRLDKATLLRQLERFVEGGVFNVIILNLAARAPIHGKDADDPPLFSDAWWDLFREVCAAARRLGVSIWFYDQIGFSGANFQGRLVIRHPEFSGLWIESAVVDAPDACFPDGCVPIAAYCGSKRLPIADGRVTGAAGPVRLVYASKRGFDYLGGRACDALFDAIYGEYERKAGDFLGSAIVGSVQDEMPSIPTWTRDFEARFQEKAGYPLLDHLPCLWEGNDAHARKVRHDFQATRARLAEEAFFRKAFEWHEKHGLQCGCDPKTHARKGNPLGCVETYADLHRTNRWYAAPGCDHHGNGRVHASLAWLNKRPRVWLEAFYASGWGGTLEDTFDWLLAWFQAGANLYNPHAVYYSTQAGNWEWAAPSTCWRQPYWRHYRIFSGAIARLCKVLAQGVPACEVGILYPTATVQAGATLAPYSGPPPDAREGWFSDLKWEPTAEAVKADEVFRALIGKMEWMQPVPGPLDRACVEYLVLDDHSLESATVEGGRLCIGGSRLSKVLLPACHTLTPKTASLLGEFAAAGGVLIAVETPPEEVIGGEEVPGDLTICRLEDVKGIFDSEGLLPRAPVSTLHRKDGGWHFLYVPAVYPRATKLQLGETWYGPHGIELDRAACAEEMFVDLPRAATSVHVWEPFEGSCALAEVMDSEHALRAKVRFDSGPVAVLMWREDEVVREPAVSAAAAKPESAVIGLPRIWTSEIIPTVGLPENDLMGAADLGFQPPQTSILEQAPATTDGISEGLAWGFSNPHAPGEEVQIGFAARGWQTDPLPLGDLPAPLEHVADGPDPLETAGWKPSVYSLTRGLRHDPCQLMSHGPSGHIPEEFVQFGRIDVGCGVHFRTGFFVAHERAAFLAIGSKAAKSAWLNGRKVFAPDDAYQSVAPVTLRAGVNILDVQLRPTAPCEAAGLFWCLLETPLGFERPEWIAAPAELEGGGPRTFCREWVLPSAPARATFQIALSGCAQLTVNGTLIGRQGGFDPYDLGVRIELYDVTNLRGGSNLIEIQMDPANGKSPLLVDAVACDPGGRENRLWSDADWRMEVGGTLPVSLANNFNYHFNRSHFYLWQRPHPLPLAADGESSPVLPVMPDSRPGKSGVEWFRWTLPPGARRMHLEVHGQARLWVEGAEIFVKDIPVELPGGEEGLRRVLLQVMTRSPFRGAAAFQGVVAYDCGRGRISLGEWSAQGLSEWSGGVAYETNVARPGGDVEALTLDLGDLRGTAEVFINGQSVGARFTGPFRYDISSALLPGENRLRVEVFNTLAPLFAAVSSTNMIHRGQEKSGLFGPVRLVTSKAP